MVKTYRTKDIMAPTQEEVDAAQKTLEDAAVPAPDASETTPVDKDAEIARLQEQLKAATASSTSEVSPSAGAKSIASEDITWASIEPGVKWGVKNGLIDVKALGQHVVKLFEENA